MKSRRVHSTAYFSLIWASSTFSSSAPSTYQEYHPFLKITLSSLPKRIIYGISSNTLLFSPVPLASQVQSLPVLLIFLLIKYFDYSRQINTHTLQVKLSRRSIALRFNPSKLFVRQKSNSNYHQKWLIHCNKLCLHELAKLLSTAHRNRCFTLKHRNFHCLLSVDAKTLNVLAQQNTRSHIVLTCHILQCTDEFSNFLSIAIASTAYSLPPCQLDIYLTTSFPLPRLPQFLSTSRHIALSFIVRRAGNKHGSFGVNANTFK